MDSFHFPYFLLLNLVLDLMSDFLLKSGHVGIIFQIIVTSAWWWKFRFPSQSPLPLMEG